MSTSERTADIIHLEQWKARRDARIQAREKEIDQMIAELDQLMKNYHKEKEKERDAERQE